MRKPKHLDRHTELLQGTAPAELPASHQRHPSDLCINTPPDDCGPQPLSLPRAGPDMVEQRQTVPIMPCLSS